MENKKVDPLAMVTLVCSVVTIGASVVSAIVAPQLQKNIIEREVAEAISKATTS